MRVYISFINHLQSVHHIPPEVCYNEYNERRKAEERKEKRKMKFVKSVGDFRIYELNPKECDRHYRVYPTFVCWEERLGTTNPDIGDLDYSENESETLKEMTEWCEKNSF